MKKEKYKGIVDYFRVGDIPIYKIVASHYDAHDNLWINFSTKEYKWGDADADADEGWHIAYFLNIDEADDIKEEMAEKHPQGRENIFHRLEHEVEVFDTDIIIISIK